MDIVMKLLIFVFGVLVGVLFMDWYASIKKAILEERMATMRNCSQKQDDAIRKKQARIENLEREIRCMRRKER